MLTTVSVNESSQTESLQIFLLPDIPLRGIGKSSTSPSGWG